MVRYNEENRKYKEINTTEMLDYIAKEFDYKKDKERDKQNDYKAELNIRAPFRHIKQEINSMQLEINALKKQVEILNNQMVRVIFQ